MWKDVSPFCASASRVGYVLKMQHGTGRKAMKSRGRWVDIGDVKSIAISCEKHALIGRYMAGKFNPVVQALRIMNMERMICVVSSQGSMMNQPTKDRVVSIDCTVRMKVGSLSVVRFGEVIPQVDEFIVDWCPVPLRFCAALRYWSMNRAGQRCTYFWK